MEVNKNIFTRNLWTSKLLNPCAGLVEPLNLAWSLVKFPNRCTGTVIFLDNYEAPAYFLHNCTDQLKLIYQHAGREYRNSTIIKKTNTSKTFALGHMCDTLSNLAQCLEKWCLLEHHKPRTTFRLSHGPRTICRS